MPPFDFEGAKHKRKYANGKGKFTAQTLSTLLRFHRITLFTVCVLCIFVFPEGIESLGAITWCDIQTGTSLSSYPARSMAREFIHSLTLSGR
jgi:hypothetical protein